MFKLVMAAVENMVVGKEYYEHCSNHLRSHASHFSHGLCILQSVHLAPTGATAEAQKSSYLKEKASKTAKTCGMLPVMIKRKTQVALICRNPGLRQKPDTSDSNTGMLYQSSQAKAN